MSAPYGWLITQDLLFRPVDGGKSAVGTFGPSGIDQHIADRLMMGEGERFRMFDDDGILYYEGRCIHDQGEEMFGPLDDFGAPNAGCTSIYYKNAAGVFQPI